MRAFCDRDDVKRCAVIVAGLSSFLTPFMGSSINIALPAIGEEFSMDAVLLAWVPMSFLLAAAVFLVPFGRLADIKGLKMIFGTGISIFTAASLLAGFSASSEMLIAFRFIQGVGSAMIFGTGIAILTSVFPPYERGRVLGINIAIVYIGLSAGPVLGGLLTQYLGWRSLFLATVPLGLLAMLLTILRLDGEWLGAEGESFDLAGSAIYAISVLTMVYGLSLLPDAWGDRLVAAGVAGLVMFLYFETRVNSPVLDVKLFVGNRVFTFSNIAALINYSATFASGFLLSLYLQYVKGMDPRGAGMILIAQPLVMAILSPYTGRLSDKKEPRIVATAGMVLTLFGIIPFAFIDGKTPIFYIVLTLAVLGAGIALFSAPNINAIMSSVDKRFYGIASATQGTMRLFGQMLSMALAMLVFALFIGRVEISTAGQDGFLEAIRTAFWLFAGLCVVGAFASMARGNIGERPGSDS